MTNKKLTAVVVCPGRGTYNKPELGYLQRLHSDKAALIKVIDDYRQTQGQTPISKLDSAEKYSMTTHTAGENASALIYGCAAADFEDIDKDKYDIVAVTGNSMGWYIALAMAQAMNAENAIQLINTMGSMMQDGIIGGQLIYPVVDENWLQSDEKQSVLKQAMDQVNATANCHVYMSINLGGYAVVAGDSAGLKQLEKLLPRIDDTYPMRLHNHAAFHSPLLAGVSQQAKKTLPVSLFQTPNLPLIDGQGKIWQPYSTDVEQLWEYTLGKQVIDTYDYSKAIEVSLKEFAPDRLIILGPGSTLGGATGQCLVEHNWQNMTNKNDFIATQQQQPFVLAMGLEDQRKVVMGH